jgi:hypothetical protein
LEVGDDIADEESVDDVEAAIGELLIEDDMSPKLFEAKGEAKDELLYRLL